MYLTADQKVIRKIKHLSFILQLCAIYLPFLQPIFRTTAIPLTSWILIVVVAFTVLIAEQIIRRFENNII